MKWLQSLCAKWFDALGRRRSHATPRNARLEVECLEDRTVPSTLVYHAPYTVNNVTTTQIYAIDTDAPGAPPQVLTSLGNNFQPEVAGDKIVFQSNRDNNNVEIYIMDLDGQHQKRLTNSAAVDYDSSFDPVSRQVAWISINAGQSDLMVGTYLSDDVGLVNVINLTSNAAVDTGPQFAPGGRIVWASNRDNLGTNKDEIYTINPNGTGLERLTFNNFRDFAPSFNFNGTKVTFTSDRDAGLRQIYTMDANGDNQLSLSNNSFAEQSSDYSVDGWITYLSNRDVPLGQNGNDVYVRSDVPGGQVFRLTFSSSLYEGPPAWQSAAPGQLQFSMANYAVGESDGAATINVARTGGSFGPVSVDWATGNGSATPGGDFTPASGTLTFLSGETTRTFDVTIAPDQDHEGDEALGLTLSSPTGGATLGLATASLTIVDDDPAASAGQLQFSPAGYSAGEADGTVLITVTRTGGSSGDVSVAWAAGGDATINDDYTITAPNLSWADGDVTARTFTITLVNDWDYENTESLTLTLSNPTGGATFGADADATLTITDDDPEPETEYPGMIVFESNRVGNTAHIFRMNSDGTGITQLTFGPYKDMIPEASEDGTLIVFASDRNNPGSPLGDFDIYTVNWDGTDLQHVVSMVGQQYDPALSPDKRYISFQSGGDLWLYDRVTMTTKNLTANDNVHQTFAAWGADGHTLVHTGKVNGSDEIFLMKLDANMNVVQDVQLTFDSSHRDFYPDISYLGDQIAWTKSFGSYDDIFIANLVQDANGIYSLDPLSITNLTNTEFVTEKVPYFSPEYGTMLSYYGNLDAPPQDTTLYEIYAMNLETMHFARLTFDGHRDMYPTWVEAPLLIAIDDVMVVEGDPDADSSFTEMVFTVTLSRVVDEPFSLGFYTYGGTAEAGIDYQPATGTVIFAPETTTQTITVRVNRDLVPEMSKYFRLKLTKSDPEGEFTKSRGLGTILDDDPFSD